VEHRREAAQNLEQFLGCPHSAEHPLAFASTVAHDEKDAFPEASLAALKAWGIFDYLIPVGEGGRLGSCEELMWLTRVLSRRDLTVAIAIGQSFLGALPVWLAGSADQKTALAALLQAGHLGCLALTEEAHGGDLMATETLAEPVAGGYRLTGSKWLINNATRGASLSLLAKTRVDSDRHESSLFMIVKHRLDPGGWQALDKLSTHGIRGADISGICFDRCQVSDNALLGNVGQGLAYTFKTLQVSRIMCAGFSLGAADTALRATLDFALGRRVLGGLVTDLETARHQIIDAYLDTLICEVVSLTAARAVDVCPDQLALVSAITKYFVPVSVERLISQLALVLGARHYLREGHYSGVFQKLMRDNAVVGLFDGSTAVNLSLIAGQLNALTAVQSRVSGATPAEDQALRRLFDFGEASDRPFLTANDLALSNKGRDLVLDGLLAGAAQRIAELERVGQTGIGDQVRGVVAAARSLGDAVGALNRDANLKTVTEERFELARGYCLVFAAAACIHAWWYNGRHGTASAASTSWLTLSLGRIGRQLNDNQMRPVALEGSRDVVWTRLNEQFRQRQLFSLLPFELAGPPEPTTHPGSGSAAETIG
jgi:alkylation response protein AidB-like acyl-CoA dehydrogenase